MPKGDNPNSRANLKPFKSVKEAREKGKKGGIKRGENYQIYSGLTEELKKQCTPEIYEELAKMLLKRAKAGNLKAFELIRDQLGEKPTKTMSVSNNIDIRIEWEDTIADLKTELAKRREDTNDAI